MSVGHSAGQSLLRMYVMLTDPEYMTRHCYLHALNVVATSNTQPNHLVHFSSRHLMCYSDLLLHIIYQWIFVQLALIRT